MTEDDLEGGRGIMTEICNQNTLFNLSVITIYKPKCLRNQPSLAHRNSHSIRSIYQCQDISGFSCAEQNGEGDRWNGRLGR